MAVEDNLLYTIPENILNSAGVLLSILKALGIVVIFYLIFSIVNTILNRKKQKQVETISRNVKAIKELLEKKR